MADEQVQKTAQEAATPEVVVNVTTTAHDVLPQPADKENETPSPSPLPETEEQPLEPNSTREAITVTTLGDKIPESAASFKEETTKVADLPDPQRKALQDLKHLLEEALHNHEFSTSVPPEPQAHASQDANSTTAPAPAEPENPEPETTRAQEQQKAPEQAHAQPVAAEPVLEDKAATPATPDDDGAKTVEAIQETIVAVSSSSVPQEQPTQPIEPEEENNKPTLSPPEADTKESKEEEPRLPEEVSIWGIPLLVDERSDVVLLKFLRARDFKVKDAFFMLKNTVLWRKQFGIDELVDEEFGSDLEKVVFMHGLDKEGHPVCYNVYGQFQNKELYQNTFSDEEKREKFLRWRIQFLERSIRKLDFTPGGISTIVQVNDLKNSPGPGKWELRQATKQALQLLQDNYPEFVAKQVFINVPWWYLAVNRMISPFLTQRTKSKFVFAGPSKTADTLSRYIAAEQIPIKYGGLSKEGESGTTDAVTEITIRPAAKHTVEFPVTEACLLSWEVRVVGWDVKYGAEFVPSTEESYTVIIQKSRKIGSGEEPVIFNSFKIGEAGKVVLTIDNTTSKKKRLLYRLKTKPCSELN
ncbi:Cellular retinaldehyde binding/alpha-tocopherol transport [Parasponia andersonii]|uniref:Cellular retinaldehyde binding/alpha-tocopherol transport n=1 Tax=Parasponia andersonii TaxID=3476 RepID=A0A2P5AGD5_PARAD|nr:Cellular retinaldehyde binding/alpha-tocopherol transport [Parasponia andersonii]